MSADRLKNHSLPKIEWEIYYFADGITKRWQICLTLNFIGLSLNETYYMLYIREDYANYEIWTLFHKKLLIIINMQFISNSELKINI